MNRSRMTTKQRMLATLITMLQGILVVCLFFGMLVGFAVLTSWIQETYGDGVVLVTFLAVFFVVMWVWEYLEG